MESARSDPPQGRGTLVNHLWNDLLARKKTQVKPMITVLFGPRGMGKTTVLRELANKAGSQAAQPHSHIDLNGHGDRPGWLALVDIAHELAEPWWPQFGRLRFPRLTLGTMVIGGHIPEDPAAAHAAILDLLRASRVPGDAGAEVARRLPQLFALPAPLEVLPDVARWVLGLKPLVKRAYKRGMDFYGAALRTAPDSGLTALRRLARADGAEVDRVLAEAFLADLRAAYASGFRPRECLLLLDNAHAPTGRRLLTALADAAKTGPAPLVVVATSGRLDLGLPGLPMTDPLAFWAGLPPDRDPLPHTGGSVQAVRLTPLTTDEVAALAEARFGRGGRGLGPLVAEVTDGHPWTAHQVLDACEQLGERPGEDELRGLLEVKVGGEPRRLGEGAARYLLLDDLPAAIDSTAVGLARDLGTATAALPGAADLQLMLAPLCWVTPLPCGRLVLPDWLRRIVAAVASDWGPTTRALRAHCARSPGRHIDVLHYEVADGHLDSALAYLNRRFDEVDAATWLADLAALTSAPSRPGSERGAWAEHVGMVQRLRNRPIPLPPTDPHGERLLTITTLLVAGLLAADPLRDPTRALASVLAQGFHDLGRRSPAGQLRFAAEADRR
ncbi:AAA family ATPase [Actinokineospora sp. NPDC004072]